MKTVTVIPASVIRNVCLQNPFALTLVHCREPASGIFAFYDSHVASGAASATRKVVATCAACEKRLVGNSGEFIRSIKLSLESRSLRLTSACFLSGPIKVMDRFLIILSCSLDLTITESLETVNE